MKLNEIGEFGFINRFTHRFSPLVKADDKGIGDDCALLSINKNEYHLVSTDLLIEDVHFLKNEITPEELGHKSLAVNLSDIAAMGGRPLYSFLSIGIPKNTTVEYLDRFMEGYHRLSNKYHVPLMGGDTTSSENKLVINVAVIGIILKKETKQRSMAETGDIICVTGPLGGSAGGLKVLLEQLPRNSENTALINLHHNPEPRTKEGRWLAQQKEIHAMMDISDGIASDLKHILKASHKAAEINLDKIPTSPLLRQVAKQEQWNITTLATSGGEDYELLITIKASDFEKIRTDFEQQLGKPLYPIGNIKDGEAELTWLRQGEVVTLNKSGFNHFKR